MEGIDRTEAMGMGEGRLFLLTGDIQTGKTRWLEALVRELQAEGIPVRGVLAPGVWRSRGAAEAGIEASCGAAGAGCAGQMQPGRGSFEKLGIDNVLLPGGERLRFARPAQSGRAASSTPSPVADLGFARPAQAAKRGGVEGARFANPAPCVRREGEAARFPRLGWDFDKQAIARVNAHLSLLVGATAHPGESPCPYRPGSVDDPGSPSAPSGESAASTRLDGAGAPTGQGGGAARPAGAEPSVGRGLLVIDELGRLELERECGLTAALDLLDAGADAAGPCVLAVVRRDLLPLAHARFGSAWAIGEILPDAAGRAAVRAALGVG